MRCAGRSPISSKTSSAGASSRALRARGLLVAGSLATSSSTVRSEAAMLSWGAPAAA